MNVPTESPKHRHADRVPAAVVSARTEDILPLVTDGASRREIFAWVREKTVWGSTVCDRTLEHYMARANRLILKRSEGSAEWYTSQALERYQRLFWRASKKGELGECRQIQAEIVKLLGLSKPERRIITIEDFDHEIERLEAELARRSTEK